MNGQLVEIGELGVGFPLFFYYMKYVGILLFAVVVVACVACFGANAGQDKQGQWGSGSSSWYLHGSSAAYGDSDSIPWWQGMLHASAVIAIILLHEMFKRRISEFGRDTDFFNASPADFTVWVKNMNQNFDQTKLKEFLTNAANKGLTTDSIYSVNIVHDVHEYMEATAKLAKLEVEVMRTKDYKALHGALPRTWMCRCKG
jgi:hypothetical protein